MKLIKSNGNLSIIRGVKVGKKYYQLSGFFDPADREEEKLVIRTLDSFKFLDVKPGQPG
jgi:hypothetical protein